MADGPLADTWNARDLPILREAARRLEDIDNIQPRPDDQAVDQVLGGAIRHDSRLSLGAFVDQAVVVEIGRQVRDRPARFREHRAVTIAGCVQVAIWAGLA